MSESEADKKRNKLGYQRISVACGHCRRRKIRCVMAEGDPQGRCQNCIRLNKECVFLPIDQQMSNEKATAASSASKATPVLSSSASHSPQELMIGRSFEQQSSSFPTVTPVPSNAPQGYPGMPFDANVSAQVEYGYRPTEYIRQWSSPGDLSPHTQAAITGPVGGYVHAPQGTFPRFVDTDSMHSTPTEVRSYSLPGPEEERQWQIYQQQQQQPSHRTMSYSTLEGTQQAYQNPQYMPAMLQTYGLPPLNMQSVQMQQGISGPQSAPAQMQQQISGPQSSAHTPMQHQIQPGPQTASTQMQHQIQPEPPSAQMQQNYVQALPFGYHTQSTIRPETQGWYVQPPQYNQFSQELEENTEQSQRTQR